MRSKNIPQGYKQTELGIIPEDWAVKTIGSLGYTYSGLSGKRKSDFGSGNAKYIPFLNILTNTQIDTNNLESVCVSNTEHQNNVAKGDLFFNTSSETPEEVGMCAVLSKDCPNTYLNSFCFGFRPFENNGANGIYLSYFFRGNSGRKLMSVLAQGATRHNLSKTNLLESSIYLPPIAEQRAIAEALSDVDGLIASLDKKIAKKRLLKQGAMQQLLTGKKRLPGFTDEWVDTSIGEGVRFQVGYPFQSQYFTSDRIGKRLVKNRDLKSDDQIVFYNGEYDYKFIVHNGDILIGMDGDFLPYKWDKGIALLNQRVGRLLPTKKWDLSFVMYALIEPLQKLQDGTGATTVKHLSHNDIEQMVLCIPQNYEEQQAIATILSDMDKEIADLEAQRDKYRLLKSGMMQKLLTGQIRLKTE